MSTPRRTVTIGLLWHSFSSDNLGVGALSESQLAICEAAAARAGVDARFIVFGTSGGRDYLPRDKGVRVGSAISFRQLLTGRSPFYREVAACDLVLDIGEGDSFADIYGLRRFREHVATKLAVLNRGVPLVLAPQTIGPFERWYARRLAVHVMRRCIAVFARDELSFAYLRDLGLEARARQAIDVAFRLPFVRPQRPADGPLRIGINVSGLLFSGGYEGTNQFGLSLDYPRHVRALLQHWTATPGMEVWLVAHVLSDVHPRDDDRLAVAALAAEFPAARVAPAFASPSEAKSFISGMDFMTGARMHACIAAFSSGVPVVPLAYSRKFNGLFKSLGYHWLADGKAMNTEEATDKVLTGCIRREALARDIAAGRQEGDRRLDSYENQLVALLGGAEAAESGPSSLPPVALSRSQQLIR